MKTNLISTGLGLITTVFILQGCATTRTDLVKEGTVTVLRLSSNNIHITRLYVYQRDCETVISGHVRFPGAYNAHRYGHVDIKIYKPDNTILKKTTAIAHHRHRRRSDTRPSHFFVRIADILPKGSTVQATYHRGNITPECEIIDNEEIKGGIK